MTDVFDAIDRAIDAGEDVYAIAVGMGQQAAESMDAGRWIIGDLASRLKKRYGMDVIGSFAKDIKVEVERVKEYRRVATFWQKTARAAFSDCPTLSYSHFRAAALLGDLDTASALLHAAADGAWSVEKTRLEVKKAVGNSETVWEKVLDADVRISRIYAVPEGMCIALTIADGLPEELIRAYQDRRVLHVVGKTEYREAVTA